MARIESITFPRIGETLHNPYERPWEIGRFSCPNAPQITKPTHDLRIPDHVNYSLKRARLAEVIEENA